MNKGISVSEREFEIINILAVKNSMNQREISSQAGMSLGMTNILLKRLIKKGYLRIRQLNQRKFNYLLTPQGFAEKAKKSYRYTLKTISSLMLIKGKIRDVLREQVKSGKNEFIVVGSGDLQDLIELEASKLPMDQIKISRIQEINGTDVPDASVLFYVSEDPVPQQAKENQINIVEAISNLGV